MHLRRGWDPFFRAQHIGQDRAVNNDDAENATQSTPNAGQKRLPRVSCSSVAQERVRTRRMDAPRNFAYEKTPQEERGTLSHERFKITNIHACTHRYDERSASKTRPRQPTQQQQSQRPWRDRIPVGTPRTGYMYYCDRRRAVDEGDLTGLLRRGTTVVPRKKAEKEKRERDPATARQAPSLQSNNPRHPNTFPRDRRTDTKPTKERAVCARSSP